MDGNTKRFLRQTLVWIAIYFAIAFIVSRFVPFPYSLAVIIAAVLGLSLFRRRRAFRNMGGGGPSGSFFGGTSGQRSVDYYCMNCGTRHNQAACPKCGSRLKKAGFGG